MQNIKEPTNSTISKIRSTATSPTSKKGVANETPTLPHWLTALFGIFTVSYQNRWTDPLCTSEMREATIQLWLASLKDFSPDVILKAGHKIILSLKYPPSISEFVELASAIQRKDKFDNEMLEREKRRLIEKQPDRGIAKKYIAQIREKLKSKQ